MHIIHNLGHGGMEGGVVTLANRIDPEKFRVSICCLEESGILAEKLDQDKVDVYIMKKGQGKTWTLFYDIYRLLKNKKVDIVHTHNYGSLLYGGGACMFCSGVGLIHGEHGDLPLQLNNRKCIFVRKFFRKKVNVFHTVSNNLKELLVEYVGVSENKVVRIPNGLDLERFKADQKQSVRQKLGISKEKFIILGVGSFHEWKNYNLLVEIARALKTRISDYAVLLAGEGPLLAGLKEKNRDIETEGYVKFLGYRKDVNDLFSASDCLVQPSVTEGMSNTIMEAMASSRPVIAFNVGGNPDLVRDGETGYLVSPGDKKGLIEKLIQLSMNKQERDILGANARETAEKRLSIERMVEDYEDLYESIDIRGLKR